MNVATATASAMLSAIDTLLNSGTLVIYSGTMPTTPETALSGNTALVTFTFAATAFGAASYSNPTEQATASFVSTTVSPAAGGVATFARAFKTDGTTVVADYTVGTTSQDIVLGNATIQTGVPVTMNSFKHTLPAV